MSNLRLKDHTWDAANVYDSSLGKTQAEINAESGVSVDATLSIAGAAADAAATGDIKNRYLVYRGDLNGADPMTADVKPGSYASQTNSESTGYPEDLAVGSYCFITYFYVSSNHRYFLITNTVNGVTWFCADGVYQRFSKKTEVDSLGTKAWQYRGDIGNGDPRTATVQVGTYAGQKKSGRTGYPDDMTNNHYCFILYQYVGSGSRAFTIFDSTSGIEWIYCNGNYHRVSQASFLNGKKWACIGDSLTYPGTLRASYKYYDSIVARTGISFVNLGVSGTGYVNDGDGQGTFITRVPDIPDDCNVVTIFGSGNDMNALPIGTATDTTNETVMGNVYLTIQAVFTQKPNVLLGIIAPTPWNQYPPYDTSNSNKMLAFTTELEKLCRMYSIPFLDLYHESNLRPWDATFRQNYYSKDGGNGVHPDENGNARFAPKIQKFLESIVLAPIS